MCAQISIVLVTSCNKDRDVFLLSAGAGKIYSSSGDGQILLQAIRN